MCAAVAVGFIGVNFVTIEPDIRGAALPGQRRCGFDPKGAAQANSKDPANAPMLDCWFATQGAVQVCIVLPLFLAAALFTYGFGQFLTDWSILDRPALLPPLLGAEVYLGQWTAAYIVLWFFMRKMPKCLGDAEPNVP